MINISFAGRIGKSAEQRSTQDGTQVVSFSVACNAGKDRTIWVSCAIFGDRGPKLVQYLTKGTSVGVTGMPSVRAWADREGDPRASLDCRVDQVSLLGSKPDGQQSGGSSDSYGGGSSNVGVYGAPPTGGPSDLDDEIPF